LYRQAPSDLFGDSLFYAKLSQQLGLVVFWLLWCLFYRLLLFDTDRIKWKN